MAIGGPRGVLAALLVEGERTADAANAVYSLQSSSLVESVAHERSYSEHGFRGSIGSNNVTS